MDQRVLDLSKLSEFILNTLGSTNEVKNLLQSQCEEAKFALAPWQIETTRKRELEKDSCTCVGVVSSEDHVKEIASGIDRAVAQARKLREKLAINVSEEKKLARRPSVQQIYTPSLNETGSKPKLSESKEKRRGSDRVEAKRKESHGTGQRNRKNSLRGESPSLKSKSKGKSERDETSIPETSRSSLNAKKISEPKRIADKKLVETSPFNSLAAAAKAGQKFKGKKNFIAANKSSVKNMRNLKSTGTSSSRIESPKTSIRVSESSSATKSLDSSVTGATSAAEIGNLISKISLESETGFINSEGNLNEGNGCPVHDKNAPKFVEEKIYTSIDVAEGLDRFGVPPELVKALKVFHSYLNGGLTSNEKNKRGEKAERRFLEEFETMNRARRKATTREKLENLSKDFLPVFRESCDRKLDFVKLSRLKIRYTDLDSVCKSLQIRSLSPTKRKVSNIVDNPCKKMSIERNRFLRLNSVWNEACFQSLGGKFPAGCLRYSNKNQLLELFELMQKIQQFKYQAKLLELLTNEVVPLVRDSLEPTSQEYADAYKMISTISNLFYLRVPVLVRTDI